MNIIKQQQQHFDRIAPEYIELRYDSNVAKHFYKMWETLLKNVSLPTDRSVNFLDAMCGGADTIDVFRKLGFTNINYSAFDYSPQMVAFAKKKHPDCRIWEQDITTFYEPNAYDVISIMGGLHHIHKHAKKVMVNIYNSLKPGGFFFSCEPTYNNAVFGKIGDYIYRFSPKFDYQSEKRLSVGEWEAFVFENNLSSEHQIYPGLFSYILVSLPFLSNINIHNRFRVVTDGFIDKLIDFERRLWRSQVAAHFSFVSFGCFRKHNVIDSPNKS